MTTKFKSKRDYGSCLFFSSQSKASLKVFTFKLIKKLGNDLDVSSGQKFALY
jgi:hypothetical protein